MRNDWDDDRLLRALGQALKARQAVPSWFIETGRNAFAWHNIEAELAQLTYDSNEDRLQAAVMRSETASIRALTFTSAHLSVELEVTGNSLLGQLLPAREGELEIHTRAGEISTTGDIERTILLLRGAGLDPRRFQGHDLVRRLVARRGAPTRSTLITAAKSTRRIRLRSLVRS